MRFLELLAHHAINSVCDVRSMPHSRINPQFDREELGDVLPKNEIEYVFLGKELGARPADKTCYIDGTVQYDRLARTEAFRSGIRHLKELFEDGFRIALMCAEKEPLECHRSILIARYLVVEGFEVRHILANGEVEEHTASIRRLSELFGLTGKTDNHMFRSMADLEADAYKLQEDKIAFRRSLYVSNEKKRQVQEHR
jgi:uncharacterized protein (DUF488 family)